MPKSMTGFGRGECIRYDRRFKVEIKSSNHRYSDFSIKLPRSLNPFEDRIRRRLAKDIARGKVDVWVNFDSFTQRDVVVQVNDVFADAYMDALRALGERYQLGEPGMIPSLELLAKNPEIITFDKFESVLSSAESQQEVWETLSDALELALEQHSIMRGTEGAAMARDIASHHAEAVELLAQIKCRAPIVVQDQAAKLNDRVGELAAQLGQQPDEARLITEIVILADKGCINEEIARLESHLQQLAQMLNEEEAVGRKLDFLMQELNREANTISSKSPDINMTQLAIELKSVIEKIREQVQNIE